MTGIRTALVIGGGIAGPVAAVALRQAGIEATVYEAYAASADGVGATLVIAPNGLDALGAIGAGEAVLAIGLPISHNLVVDGRGRPIGEFPRLADLPPSRAMWRPDLYRVLHEHAKARGVAFEYGKRLVGAEETPDGVLARFADGSTAVADVLVGADGVGSAVRSLIDPHAPDPEHVPLLNFGGLADLKVPARPDAVYFVYGNKGFLGYWVQPDGRTAWWSNLPHGAPMTAAQARETAPEEWLRRLAEVYAGDVPGRDLVRHTSPRDLSVLGTMHIMPSTPRWHRGRMVLVGDSVHAPSSSSGQGASLAVESAIELARCLRDLPDAPAAFAAYERLRRPRVESVAARAARTNNTKTLGPVGRTMMKLMMPLAMKTFLTPEKTLGPEQRHHIDWDAPAA
ncbi:FAD-dependent oxidoreductase [Sphaerisporangium siamense]|uniref:2-polyprenyl-6-methoxyphenol hydroxylase-like FAD-dependent oxidoreductase n=1 Tax=Sphaerisporangium siamense TaxID=795645 RepID=A0A7W7DAR6_9ACTN|nr:FAD-dependent monooxygenase [Sphaerisporangium siamense]MBB4703397.1 2-polyprenyl-6-methoxyphenol hydroxylase-like FAD-dependent oxidoreductase [Sphaerisporangium siamense]GII87608.1 FAD-dependent oxidoreductase [Sphaerisporangium siamense]